MRYTSDSWTWLRRQRLSLSSYTPLISDVRLKRVSGGRDGLVGWVSLVLSGQVLLRNLALRNTGGGYFLTYPRRATERGTTAYFCPVSEEARRRIERVVLRSLDLMEEGP